MKAFLVNPSPIQYCNSLKELKIGAHSTIEESRWQTKRDTLEEMRSMLNEDNSKHFIQGYENLASSQYPSIYGNLFRLKHSTVEWLRITSNVCDAQKKQLQLKEGSLGRKAGRLGLDVVLPPCGMSQLTAAKEAFVHSSIIHDMQLKISRNSCVESTDSIRNLLNCCNRKIILDRLTKLCAFNISFIHTWIIKFRDCGLKECVF